MQWLILGYVVAVLTTNAAGVLRITDSSVRKACWHGPPWKAHCEWTVQGYCYKGGLCLPRASIHENLIHCSNLQQLPELGILQ